MKVLKIKKQLKLKESIAFALPNNKLLGRVGLR